MLEYLYKSHQEQPVPLNLTVKVKIKQLFTYDLVADPGFANAELKRVNESYGFYDNSLGYI